jgi:hypothetical protein
LKHFEKLGKDGFEDVLRPSSFVSNLSDNFLIDAFGISALCILLNNYPEKHFGPNRFSSRLRKDKTLCHEPCGELKKTFGWTECVRLCQSKSKIYLMLFII